MMWLSSPLASQVIRSSPMLCCRFWSALATQYTSAGITQTLFALTPILIIAPAALLFHQKVTLREVLGAIISVIGVCLFFV